MIRTWHWSFRYPHISKPAWRFFTFQTYQRPIVMCIAPRFMEEPSELNVHMNCDGGDSVILSVSRCSVTTTNLHCWALAQRLLFVPVPVPTNILHRVLRPRPASTDESEEQSSWLHLLYHMVEERQELRQIHRNEWMYVNSLPRYPFRRTIDSSWSRFLPVYSSGRRCHHLVSNLTLVR